jgi:excisionase family DNA binding protein
MTTVPPSITQVVVGAIQDPTAKALVEALLSRVLPAEADTPASPIDAEAKRYLHAIRLYRGWKHVESRWRVHILPKLGTIPVNQLRPSQVEALLSEMQEQGYSQQTRRHIRVTLHAFYEWLRRDESVKENPIARVRNIAIPEGNPKALTEEQVRALAAAATFEGIRRLILLGFFTACRVGELLALQWEDVDWEHARLHVRRSLGSDTTKTGKSRILELPGEAVGLLRDWREDGNPIIFRCANGNPLDRRHALRSFKVALKRAGLTRGWEAKCRRKNCGFREERKVPLLEGEKCPRCSFKLWGRPLPAKFTIKDLRSSCITHIVEKTGDMRAAQIAAGHSSMATTERHYAKKRQEHVRRRIDEAFPSADGQRRQVEIPPAPQSSAPATPLLTAVQVAKRLSVSRATVYVLCAKGKLRFTRVSGAIRIEPASLDAFIAGGTP